MNQERFTRVAGLYLSASSLPMAERGAFLDRECQGDVELRREVEALIAAGDQSPATAHLAGGLASQAREALAGGSAGDVILPYTLVSKLGEGGFGDVWLAERTQPFTQRVAIKIIKPGMDSRAVVARFTQERQSLAILDHPHIAKVFDGGVTDRGRPYFVMEYVKGQSITMFASERRLSLRERLELFIPVCEAVQHAHRKGIIHRDLKPSNILVEEVDGQAMPKVIDFGVAKAVDHAGAAKTLMTDQGMLVGTPEYMSPEQAEGLADIDTRTDVYSLGVVLYELLVGAPPFDGGELRSKGYVELLRIIREVEPPRPSTRVLTMAEKAATGAAGSRSRELARELEWIPLKALRKVRERRYSSPESLAADIRRYLAGEALEAGPESRFYRARKFVRRHRVPVLAATAVVSALVVGLAVALWQRSVAREAQVAEKERADQLKEVSDFQSSMLSQIDLTKAGRDLMADVQERFVAGLEKASVPEEERARRVDALRQELVRVNATDAAAALIDRTILRPAIKTIDEKFSNDPKTDASLRQALANFYRTIGLYEAAHPLQESALATRLRVLGTEHEETLFSIGSLGVLLVSEGKLGEAEPYIRQALEKFRRVSGEEHSYTLNSITNMGNLLVSQGKFDEAEPYCREAMQKSRRVLGDNHPDTLTAIITMGSLLALQGNLTGAEPLFSEALERARKVLGEDDPRTLAAVNGMGFVLQAQDKLEMAEPYYSEALEQHRRVQGEEHPDTLGSINNMGYLLQAQGKLAEAQPFFIEALEKRRRILGEEHPDTLSSINNMGFVLKSQGKLVQAEPYYREALDKSRRFLGEVHPFTLVAIGNMGGLLKAQDRLDEAEPYYREALEKSRRVLGEEHLDTLGSINNMGFLLEAQGKLAEAEPYFREAMEKGIILLGQEHSGTLTFINNLGHLLGDLGKNEEAIELLAPAEPAARKAFTGDHAHRFATFLTALAHARVDLGFDADRFTLAESNLLEARRIYVQTRGETHTDTLECVQALVDLYNAWDRAEPGKGCDAKAADWKAKLEAAKRGAQSAPPPSPASSQPK